MKGKSASFGSFQVISMTRWTAIYLLFASVLVAGVLAQPPTHFESYEKGVLASTSGGNYFIMRSGGVRFSAQLGMESTAPLTPRAQNSSTGFPGKAIISEAVIPQNGALEYLSSQASDSASSIPESTSSITAPDQISNTTSPSALTPRPIESFSSSPKRQGSTPTAA
jgi:hypothetical protein